MSVPVPGATVGKIGGMNYAQKSGLGIHSVRVGNSHSQPLLSSMHSVTFSIPKQEKKSPDSTNLTVQALPTA